MVLALGLHLLAVDEKVLNVVAKLEGVLSDLDGNGLNVAPVLFASGSNVDLEALVVVEGRIVDQNEVALAVVVKLVSRPGLEVLQ